MMKRLHPPKYTLKSQNPSTSQMTSINHRINARPQSFYPKYPASPQYPPGVSIPPAPILEFIEKPTGEGKLMLTWNFHSKKPRGIIGYELYTFLQGINVFYKGWRKLAYMTAMTLPMACTFSLFERYDTILRFHFIIRAVDNHGRVGRFSPPVSFTRQQYLFSIRKSLNWFTNPSPPIRNRINIRLHGRNEEIQEPFVISSEDEEPIVVSSEGEDEDWT